MPYFIYTFITYHLIDSIYYSSNDLLQRKRKDRSDNQSLCGTKKIFSAIIAIIVFNFPE